MIYLCLLLTLLLLTKPLAYYRAQRWEQRMQLKKHLAVLKDITDPINGFDLSRQARADNDAFEYVYGEIDNKSLIALLSLVHPDDTTVFYDLGSGTGKAVLACAMVFKVKKSCGVELFPILDKAAKQQLDQLSRIPKYYNYAARIVFLCDSFLNTQLTDATVIYLSATGLFGDTWIQLNQKLEQLHHCPIIITTSKKLLSPRFKLRHQTLVQMSWGVVNAYIQQRDN